MWWLLDVIMPKMDGTDSYGAAAVKIQTVRKRAGIYCDLGSRPGTDHQKTPFDLGACPTIC